MPSHAKDDRQRALLTYAMASSGISTAHDIYQAVTPFFRPITLEIGGQIIDPEYLRKRAETLYGFSLSTDVIEELLPRLTNAGYVVPIYADDQVTGYRAMRESDAPQPVDDIRILESLDRIAIEFRKFHSTIKLSELAQVQINDYVDTLLDWIVSFDSVVAPAYRTVADSIDERYWGVTKERVNYLCARFIQYLKGNDEELFMLLEDICSAALLMEIIADFRSPRDKYRQAPNLAVYLDGPFLMGALNLSGTTRYENAKFIIRKLREMDVKIRVMPHSCDELSDNVKAVLSRPLYEATGPTADAIRKNELLPDFARAVASDVPQFLNDAEIEYDIYSRNVRNFEDHRFSNDYIDELKQHLVTWKRETAKERDGLSIAQIIRLRNRKGSTDVFHVGALLVSRNRTLCKIAKQFCIVKGLQRPEWIGPAITQRQMAGLLWLTLGDDDTNKKELSRKFLLSSCEQVLRSDPDVVRRARERAKELDRGLSDQLDALLLRPRCVQALMDVTLGSEEVVSGDNIGIIIDAMEQALEERYRERNELLQAELVSQREAELEKLEQTHIKSDEALHEQVQELQSVKENAEESLRSAGQRDEAQVNHILSAATKHAVKIRWQAKIGFTLLALTLAVASGFSTAAYRDIGTGVTIAVIVTTLSLVFLISQVWRSESSSWFGRWLVARRRKFVERRLSEAGRNDLILIALERMERIGTGY